MADSSAVLTLPITDLIEVPGQQALFDHFRHHFEPQRPKKSELIIGALGTLFARDASAVTSLANGATYVAKNITYTKRLRAHYDLAQKFTVAMPLLKVSEDNRSILRGMVHLVAADRINPQEWRTFLAQFVWHGGESILTPDPDARTHPDIGSCLAELRTFFKTVLPEFQTLMADAATTIFRQPAGGHLYASSPASLMGGDSARWMSLSDLKSCPFYSTVDTPEALLLGYEATQGLPVFFRGHESLITIGGPGSGKSQSQVIPNLFRYRGSCIVLDVMNELWPATAAYRRRHFGPVYRFAPTDKTGNTHRYNPFDFISRHPEQAARDCTIFSYQVIAENPKLNDPYWENRGRDIMWAFAVMVATILKGPSRTMMGLAEAMNMALDKDPKSDLMRTLAVMNQLGQTTGIGELSGAANAISTGIKTESPRLESVFDTARRYLSIFSRMPSMAATMATSDWDPELLRARPGTTLYICLSVEELKAFGPLVRLMLKQHANVLLSRRASPDDLPVTFMLDEMPRLGDFESLLELQAVGRGAGVRLWMFAQTVGQLANAFGDDHYQGVIDACRVRCFLQPENQAADMIQRALGSVRKLFESSKDPLAEAHDLMGRAYRDKIIVTTRGDYPMALDKKFAWQTDKPKFMPPPAIPRRVK